MLDLRLRPTIDPPWTYLEPVRVGVVPPGVGTPDRYVTVERDGAPLLRVDIYADQDSPFDEAVDWADHVVIGFGDCVHFVQCEPQSSTTFRLSSYFGHPYPLHDRILVADGFRLYCFDRAAALLWTSQRLGID